MNELLSGSLGIFGVLLILFLLLLAILWFFLPFAIFGTKDKLSALILKVQKTNAELARISTELSATRTDLANRAAQAQVAGHI